MIGVLEAAVDRRGERRAGKRGLLRPGRGCDREREQQASEALLQRAAPTAEMRAARSPPVLRIFTSR